MVTSDWQFWIVSIIALFAVLVLIRPFFPRWKKSSCCSNAAKPKKTKLTIHES